MLTISFNLILSLLSLYCSSRKRPPSDSYDCSSDQCKVDDMNECNAALILMNLHNSPHAGRLHALMHYYLCNLHEFLFLCSITVSDKWLGSSPGSSSSASWSSGSASPPLSDDGNVLHGHIILSPQCAASASANARIRTTSVSTSDEGIVIDFKEERKKKVGHTHSHIHLSRERDTDKIKGMRSVCQTERNATKFVAF